MACFSLIFRTDDDGDVLLLASIDTGEFKGQCHYWCAASEFADLAEALKTFPITNAKPLDMHWYDGCIELRIEPVDSVGHLAVRVALRDFSSDWSRCQSEFRTEYGALDRFRDQLKTVLKEGLGEAVLHSS
jgi:hypothetical protein